MKKKLQKVLGAIGIFSLCLGLFTPVVKAEETPGVSLPVTVLLDGTLPEKEEDFVIKLKAENEANPMPEGSKENPYSMVITGEKTQSFPEITFQEVGVYEYTVWQDKGDNEKCTYDGSIFYVTIYVTNEENGDGLETTVAVYKDGNKDKKVEIEFENIYETEPEKPDETIKTGDVNNAQYYSVLCLVSMLLIMMLIQSKKIK